MHQELAWKRPTPRTDQALLRPACRDLLITASGPCRISDKMLHLHVPENNTWRTLHSGRTQGVRRVGPSHVRAAQNGLGAIPGRTTVHKILEKDGVLLMPGNRLV